MKRVDRATVLARAIDPTIMPTAPTPALEFPSTIYPKAPVRAADLQRIVRWLQRGQHVAIVGASNAGKSTLLQSLAVPPMPQACALQQRHRPAPDTPAHTPLIIFVDCLEASGTAQAFYELLLRRTLAEVTRYAANADDSPANGVDPASELATTLRDAHHQILQTEQDVALRAIFAAAMHQLLRESQAEVIFILDEFDDVFRQLPPWPLRQLRVLADAHGTRLRYVAATTQRLVALRADSDTYEFRELFQLATHVLAPLSPNDVVQFLAYLNAQRPIPLDAALASVAHHLSGGHPGLLERIHNLLYTQQNFRSLSPTAAVDWLYEQIPILRECERLWDELEAAERNRLHSLVADANVNDGSPTTSEAHQSLLAKGILADDSTTRASRFLSPLFERFVRTQADATPGQRAAGIYLEQVTNHIWADGVDITWELGSEHQRDLLRLLGQNAGEMVSYDEIAEAVWGVGEGVTPAAIRELVNRTRRKLPNPNYIANVPGQGYRLQNSP